MSEQENGTLSLDEVARRFAESEQALGKAREKLEALASAEVTQAAASRSLQETSTATKELVAAARTLILEAEETQQTARAVLQAGAGLIDGTDLKELREGVTWTATTVQEGFERIERLLGEVRERDQRIAELETELARRTDALSSRQRKKLGLG
jgi:hypothetical protein